MDVKIAPDWKELLAPEFEKPYFAQLTEFIRQEYATRRIYPRGSNIFRAFDKCPFDKLKVGIVGDIGHSRVCGSLIPALKIMGCDVTVIAPPTLMPARPDVLGADRATSDLDAALPELDVVYMLRIQRERFEGAPYPNLREYNLLYGLTEQRDKLLKPDACVCHPGPINRGVELDSFMADHPKRSIILDQVYAGVLVRMAALYLLLGGSNDGIDA